MSEVAFTRSCNTARRVQLKESATTVDERRWSGCRMIMLCRSSMMIERKGEKSPMMWTKACSETGVSIQKPRRWMMYVSLDLSGWTCTT